MKTKKLIVTAFIIVLLAALVLYVFMVRHNQTENISIVATSTEELLGSSTTPTGVFTGNEEIKIANITPNQTIGNPVTITGAARGWYFEASFPVRVLDANGVLLWEGPAQAQGDWMTSEFVPFKVVIAYKTPTTKTGTLVFHNDNPSGLPENDRSYTIPVTFSGEANQETMPVTLYYYNSNLDKDANGNILCSEKGLTPVTRVIPKTQTPLTATLQLLFKGELSNTEKNSGIVTEYPLLGVELASASLSSTGVLSLSISDPYNKLSGGACRVSILKAGLEKTALQFPTIKSVVYTSPVFEP